MTVSTDSKAIAPARLSALRAWSQRATFALTMFGAAVVGSVATAATPGLAQLTLVNATEYYYTPLDYYFITSRDSDKVALDGASGWTRTGRSFGAFSAPIAGTAGLTRYYFDKVAVKATRGSHFYTVLDSDREALAALNPGNSLAAGLPYFEGNDSFAYPPVASGTNGSCPAGTQTVYRVFRGNAKFPDNPNHRFTTDQTLYQQFVGLGWDAEGVNFCVPTTVADTSACPQTAYFPDVSSRNFYVDKNLDGKTSWDSSATLQPAISVSCTNSVVSVASNGVPNFDSVGIGVGGATAAYQTNVRTWRFPQQPLVAATPTELRNVLGPIAVMINGVQIYGPVESPADNFADPFKAGLTNYCGGHVTQYHYHAFPECFFNQKTLAGTTTFLPAKTPGVVLGYAFDGFPILSPYEYCSNATDSSCVNGIREIKSAYRYSGTGAYTTEAAFDNNVFVAGYNGSTLDRCNGKSDGNGGYAYYATRQFPYYLACYSGTATRQQ
jgi:YHYH protein/Repeat of unknown function (DUF5648)